ncbi:MAG: glycosyltransferase family 2 protein [Acidimicrobiales bacterium]
MSPAVSVVMVTWNSARDVAACIRSLQVALASLEWELVVVDNGSRDSTLSEVRQAAPEARVVANPANRGLAAANNQGLVASSGPAVVICNPDVIFGPESLTSMLAVLGRHDRAGWVVPRLTYEDGRPQTSAGDLPSLREALFGRQASRRRSPGQTTGFWWDGWPHDEERAIGRGHEAAYIVRREAVAQVGLQDERYVLDWEGVDWTDRFRRAGWEIWLAPEAEVVHLGGTSIRQVPIRWVISQHRGMYRYFAERRGGRPLLAAAFAIRALLKAASIGVGLPMYQWAHRDPRDR